MRAALGVIAYILYRLLSLTWRVKLTEPEILKSRLREKLPVIFAHWHGDELALIHLVGHYRCATIVSNSKDGQIMDVALRLLGAKTSRGSSTRGAVAALKGLIRLMKEGNNCSFAVDGPKGPLHEVKPGVFEVSRLVHAPIFPGSIFVDRAWRFPKSWNKTYLPKPFARVEIIWQEPIPAISTDPKNMELANDLKARLDN